jgi:glycosyltransferase involved in cell wall biosynthesis
MTTFEPRTQGRSDDLVYLGRMEQQKGPDIAVRVARRLGRRLTLAGPMTNDEFFDAEIRPFLDERVRYVGVADHGRKNELLAQAACVLMPSRWEEPFGLVAVEAMACGTPVAALRGGALPEVVEEGVSGAIAADEEGLADAVGEALMLDRRAIRARAEQRFEMGTVARQYVDVYDRITSGEWRAEPLERAEA